MKLAITQSCYQKGEQMQSDVRSQSVIDQVRDANDKARRWFADGQAALKAGNELEAKRCSEMQQLLLDRAHLLSGLAELPFTAEGKE